MTPESKAEYRRLAQEIMEPVLTVAGRRLEQAIGEIHETEIKPLKKAVLLAVDALKVARPVVEWARDTGSRDDKEVALWALSRIDAAILALALKQEGGGGR